MSILEIKNLTKDYGEGKGVFNLNLSVEKGECFGFLGPNGAGKTTTIRHLCGFLTPDIGECLIGGLNCRTNSAKIHSQLGYIPGEMAFFNGMTGAEFISFMADYRGLKNMYRVNELIDRFELNTGVKIKKMSKGMKQKIGIICAFMHEPQIYILDEPTSGLDPLMQNRFIELVKEETAKGKTILMSSHIFEEIEKTCSKVAIIKNGKLMATNTIEGLKSSKNHKFSIVFNKNTDANAFSKMGFDYVSISDTALEVTVGSDINPFIAALSDFSISSLTSVSQSLEDIFMNYYGGNKNV